MEIQGVALGMRTRKEEDEEGTEKGGREKRQEMGLCK